MNVTPPRASAQTAFPSRKSAADMSTEEPKAGLPTDGDVQVPLGYRAAIASANLLRGSF